MANENGRDYLIIEKDDRGAPYMYFIAESDLVQNIDWLKGSKCFKHGDLDVDCAMSTLPCSSYMVVKLAPDQPFADINPRKKAKKAAVKKKKTTKKKKKA
jgi:hypothetical protein